MLFGVVVLDIRFQASAAKALRKLYPVWQQRIRTKLYEYAAEPSALGNMVKRLAGDGWMRLRVGDYRVIFTEDASSSSFRKWVIAATSVGG